MTPTPLETVGTVVGTAIGTAVAVAVVMIPWLRQYVRKPLEAMRTRVSETHHQVTVNHHASEEPTVLDQLHTLEVGLERLEGRVGVMATIYDNHVDHTAQLAADREERDARVDAVLERLEARLGRTDRPDHPGDYDPDPNL